MGNKGGKAGSKDSKVPVKPPKLNSKDLKFLESKTGLSQEQIESIWNQFNANNPDGLLSRDEFGRLYQGLRSEPVTNLDEIQNMVFRAFDSDNNGSLTFNEFLIGYTLTSRGDQKQKLDYAFELYDADNNGYLTENEVREVIRCMLDLLGAPVHDSGSLSRDIAAQLDTSHDSRISKDEFISGLLKNYNLRVLMEPFN